MFDFIMIHTQGLFDGCDIKFATKIAEAAISDGA